MHTEKWTLDKIEFAWNRMPKVPGRDPNEWRYDICGALIHYSERGLNTPYGWVIDHIYPESAGGGSEKVFNMFPNLWCMQWQNNRNKSDNFPTFEAVIPMVRTVRVPKKLALFLFNFYDTGKSTTDVSSGSS